MRENQIGDGAKRARIFGGRTGRYNLQEAANLAGVAYSTLYHWVRNGVFGELELTKGEARPVFSADDVFALAVLRDIRSRTKSDSRGRTNRALRRARLALEEGLKATAYERRGYLVVTDSRAAVIQRSMFGPEYPTVEALDLDEVFAFQDASRVAVIVSLAAVNRCLPDVIKPTREQERAAAFDHAYSRSNR